MIAEKLRKAVLQAAMEGKLTNQDLYDNSVVEILTKIEMNKGIKFRVINEDEKPYSIPMNWVWISHNDILETSGGSQPPKSTFSELPKESYIRLYQIRDYGLNPQPVYIPIETATKQTKKGDILLARYGASLGKVFYAEEGAYNVAMAKVIPLFKEDILYNDFLFYYYKSSQYQSLVLKNTRSAQAGFNKNDLNKLLIALPPIEEQKRIVEKLEVLLAEIDKLEQDEKALKDLEDKFPEKLKTSILKSAMEGKLTNQLFNDSKTIITIDKKYAQFQQEQIPYTIPENWKWFRVKELFVIRNGFTPLRSNMDFWNSKDVPWFTVNDIRNQGRVITYTDQYISNLAVTDNKVVPKNSILLCCTASIGEYALTKIDLTTNQQFNGMTIKDKYQEFIDIWFVYYWVQTIKEEMISKAGKTTFPFLSVTKLGDFLIPLPPIEEQNRIVQKLDELFRIDLLNI